MARFGPQPDTHNSGTFLFDRMFLLTAPQPFAALLIRIQNTEDPFKRFALVLQLAEAYVRLSALVPLAMALHERTLHSNEAPTAQKLDRPSLGHFRAIRRELGKSKLPARAMAFLDECKRGRDIPAFADCVHLVMGRGSTRPSFDDVLDALVTQRSRGHAKKGVEEDDNQYACRSPILLRALLAALEHQELDPTFGLLAAVTEARHGDPSWRLERWSLRGAAPLRAGWVDAPERVPPFAACLWEDGQAPIPLAPFVVVRDGKELEVMTLDGVKTAALSYVNLAGGGSVVRGVPAEFSAALARRAGADIRPAAVTPSAREEPDPLEPSPADLSQIEELCFDLGELDELRHRLAATMAKLMRPYLGRPPEDVPTAVRLDLDDLERRRRAIEAYLARRTRSSGG